MIPIIPPKMIARIVAMINMTNINPTPTRLRIAKTTSIILKILPTLPSAFLAKIAKTKQAIAIASPTIVGSNASGGKITKKIKDGIGKRSNPPKPSPNEIYEAMLGLIPFFLAASTA